MYDIGLPDRLKQVDGAINFFVDCPPQSPTVRGLAMILVNGLNGSSLEEILLVPPDFFVRMRLDEAVSQQRLTGFRGRPGEYDTGCSGGQPVSKLGATLKVALFL